MLTNGDVLDTAQKPYIKSILHAAGHSRDDFAVNNSLFRCFGDKDGEIELQEVCRNGCVTMQDDEGFNDTCRPGDKRDSRQETHEAKAPTAKTTTTEVHVVKLHPETDTYVGKAQIKTIARSL